MTFFRTTLLWLIAITCLGSWLPAQDQDLPTVAVVGFSTSPGAHARGFRETFQEILSIGLARTGRFRVLERAKLDALLREQALSLTGLADDQQSLVKVGRLLGADYLLTGSLLALDTQANRFSGYGVDTTTYLHTMRVSAKLIETNSSQIVYGDVITSQKSDRQFASSGSFDSGIQNQLLADCGMKLTFQVEAYASQHPAELAKKRDGSQLIEVTFESDPPGATILVDGLAVGNTPFRYKAAGGVHRITMSLAGFNPWDEMTRLAQGQRIWAKLQKPPEKKPDLLIILP